MTDIKSPLASSPKAAAPTIKRFNGASSVDQQKLVGLSFTPDSNGAASYSYFVEFINSVFSIYDKETGSLIGTRVSDTQFWVSAGIQRPGNIVDPRIVFIPDAGRHGQWLAVQLDLGNRVFIATTDPSEPLADPSVGKWKASEFALPGNDFVMLGYDARGVYIGTNSEAGPGPGRSPQIVFIPRSNALAYPPQVSPDAITIIGPVQKAEYGESLYPIIDQSGAGWQYETVIGVDNVSKKHLTFSLISPEFKQILSHGRIEVEPFEPVSPGYRVRQPSPDAYRAVLWSNDGIVAAPMGDGFNIWLAQTVISPKYGSLAVRWYRLYIDPMTRMPGLAAWGEISKGNYDCFNPSILSFGKDDYTVVSLSRSGGVGTPVDPSKADCGNIGAYAVLVRESDPTPPEFIPLMSGQAFNYMTPIMQRWGDYSTICRDPDRNARRAWIVNQYVLQGGASVSQWCDVIASIELA